jgi:hypothetical protein
MFPFSSEKIVDRTNVLFIPQTFWLAMFIYVHFLKGRKVLYPANEGTMDLVSTPPQPQPPPPPPPLSQYQNHMGNELNTIIRGNRVTRREWNMGRSLHSQQSVS